MTGGRVSAEKVDMSSQRLGDAGRQHGKILPLVDLSPTSSWESSIGF